MQIVIPNRVNDIEGIVGGMGNIKPTQAAMHGCMIESTWFKIFRQLDVSEQF
jgi:hypothetical protein